jgi:hypothetical protein
LSRFYGHFSFFLNAELHLINGEWVIAIHDLVRGVTLNWSLPIGSGTLLPKALLIIEGLLLFAHRLREGRRRKRGDKSCDDESAKQTHTFNSKRPNLLRKHGLFELCPDHDAVIPNLSNFVRIFTFL